MLPLARPKAPEIVDHFGGKISGLPPHGPTFYQGYALSQPLVMDRAPLRQYRYARLWLYVPNCVGMPKGLMMPALSVSGPDPHALQVNFGELPELPV